MKKFLIYILFLIFIFPAYSAEQTSPTTFYNKGIDFYEQDKFEDSISAFKRAIALEPEFYEAWYNLARVQESAGKIKDAINSYETLLKIAPEDYESAFQFGELLYKTGYLSKSFSYLNKIPGNSEYKKEAEKLCTKIKERQKQLESEAKIKAEQNLKSNVIGNIPAPSGLVVDSSGNMFVASFSESKIIKISRDGASKFVFADKTNGLDGPIGLAIDCLDNIYVANYNKGDILLLDKKGNGRILMYAKKPYGLSLSEKHAKIYITEQQNNSVISYDISEILGAKKTEGVNIEIENPVAKAGETKVITAPDEDKAPTGVPSVVETGFSKSSTQSRTAPIMIPSSESIFEL